MPSGPITSRATETEDTLEAVEVLRLKLPPSRVTRGSEADVLSAGRVTGA